jgi:hypothetical protein
MNFCSMDPEENQQSLKRPGRNRTLNFEYSVNKTGQPEEERKMPSIHRQKRWEGFAQSWPF